MTGFKNMCQLCTNTYANVLNLIIQSIIFHGDMYSLVYNLPQVSYSYLTCYRQVFPNQHY